MTTIFLHGGGDDPAHRTGTFGMFVRILTVDATAPLALVVAEATHADQQTSFAAYRAIFTDVGLQADHIIPIFVSPQTPLRYHMLEELHLGGVFICGGATPTYQQSLCQDPSWTNYLVAANIPYGGTSAGAAIAARTAIVGGWKAERENVRRPMLFHGAGEGLDLLTTAPGLGLVPFAVDVHASQWGTLLRLIHAVDLGVVRSGWAIDENTVLAISDGATQVFGQGHAYYVERTHSDAPSVTIHINTQKQ